MSARWPRFNSYLLLLLPLAILGLAGGCKTAEERRRGDLHTSLWLHVESPSTLIETNHLAGANIAGIRFVFSRRPFLTEDYVQSAELIDTPQGGYAIEVGYDDHGRMALDAVSAEARGRHIVILAKFGPKKKPEQRWIAAPLVRRRITDGVFTFTPDATRQEAEDIVFGLKNVARKNAQPWVF